MSLASILERSAPAAAARRRSESFKLTATRQPRGYDKTERQPVATPRRAMEPLFCAAFYDLFMPAAYSVSQNLTFLVTS